LVVVSLLKMPFSRLGVDVPFDQVAFVFLLAEADKPEQPIFDPATVAAWIGAFNEYKKTTMDLGGIMPQISDRGAVKWSEPAIFTFWLAVQKELFKKLLEDKSMEGQAKELVEEAVDLMKNVPSKKEAAERVHEKDHQYGGGLLWIYFGREYGRSIEMAFLKGCPIALHGAQ
jgi:hypothetical protein